MDEEKFVNLTSHVIAIRTQDGTLRIPPCGTVLRLQEVQRLLRTFSGVDIVETAYQAPAFLPEPKEGVVYLVSSLVAQAVKDRDDIVSPDTGSTAVRQGKRVVAVRQLQQFTWENITGAEQCLQA